MWKIVNGDVNWWQDTPSLNSHLVLTMHDMLRRALKRNNFIIYSSSCRTKPVRGYFFHRPCKDNFYSPFFHTTILSRPSKNIVFWSHMKALHEKESESHYSVRQSLRTDSRITMSYWCSIYEFWQAFIFQIVHKIIWMAFSSLFFCRFGVMVTLKRSQWTLYSFLLYGKVQREESTKNSLSVFQRENNSIQIRYDNIVQLFCFWVWASRHFP